MGRYSKVGPLILLQPFPARFALYTTRIPRSPVAMHSLNISILGIWRVCPFSSFFSGSLVFCFSVRFYWASQHHGWVFLLLSVWQICVCCLMYDIDLCRLPGDDEVSRVVVVVGHNHTCCCWSFLWTFGWISLFVKLPISFFPLFFRFGFLCFLFAEMMSDVKFVEHYHGVIFSLHMEKFSLLLQIYTFLSWSLNGCIKWVHGQ